MKLTKRQEKILDIIIREYVNSAQPVSSQLLEKKHDFGISPATIRIEMQKLTDKGFLLQPHTSAGRVPTDKGYRVFVNNLLGKKETKEVKKETKIEKWSESSDDDHFKFIQSLTRQLAEETKSLVLNYIENEDIFWKEGWEEVFKAPEFGERDNIIDFAKLLKNFETHIEELETEPGVRVYIGKENSFPKAKNFTVITSRYHLPGGERGIISIFGPKRMAYEKNISSINSLMRLFDNL
ncbi:hypothetical protein ACFLYY_01390 [Patescibacteria group bacterium]